MWGKKKTGLCFRSLNIELCLWGHWAGKTLLYQEETLRKIRLMWGDPPADGWLGKEDGEEVRNR